MSDRHYLGTVREGRPSGDSEVANRNGGRSRARTCDPGLVRAVLFRLSYPPVSRIVGGDPDTVNRRARLQGRRPYVLYSSATRGACAVAAARSASAPARSPTFRLARPRP